MIRQVRGEHPFAGKWFARVGSSIVSVGGSPEQVYIAARASRTKEKIILSHIPQSTLMPFPSILNEIANVLAKDQDVYLVGGAVRDALLGQTGNDIDLCVFADAQKIARKLANALRADLYTLDAERQAYRIITESEGEGPLYIDITRGRGQSLDEDLAGRDFTINAIAVDIQVPQRLIDPLGGAQDLAAKKLRTCSQFSLQTDPVRSIRAARLAADLQLQVEKDTLEQVVASRTHLQDVSPERRRDEIMKGLQEKPATFIRLLHMLGLAAHVSSALQMNTPDWEDRLARLRLLERLLILFQNSGDREQNIWSGVITSELGQAGQVLLLESRQRLQQDRPRAALWALACLSGGDENRMAVLAEDLVLANVEKQSLAGAMHAMEWLRERSPVSIEFSDREVYQFFRAAGPGGLDALMLWMIDSFLQKDGHLVAAPPVEQLRICRRLLDAWQHERGTIISPEVYINGHDAQHILGIPPGAELGQLLNAMREEQAAGTIKDRAGAEVWARAWWKSRKMG